MTNLRTTLRAFSNNHAGNVAMLFGVSMLVFAFFIGIAIDMGRATRASAGVTGALDSAALAGAKAMVEEELPKNQVMAVVSTYLTRALADGSLQGVRYENMEISIDPAEGNLSIEVDIVVPTTFTAIGGRDVMRVHKSVKTAYKLKNVELAMVLDTTGSMKDGKLDDLKEAAKKAIDILLPPGKTPLNRIALAPFSGSVNAGSYAAGVSGGLSADCVVERDGADAYTDTSAAAAPVNYYVVDAEDCPDQSIVPMSKDGAALKTLIDGYTDDGGTAGQIGLAWGWYLISPNWNNIWPSVSDAKPYNDGKTIKAIILMTDGLFNREYFNDTSANQAKALCDAIKVDGVTVYTIGFALSTIDNPLEAAAANDILEYCASDMSGGGKEFISADSGTDLMAAFETIAGKLSALRLTN